MATFEKRSKRIKIEGNINKNNEKLIKGFLQAKKIAGLSEKTIYVYKCDLYTWAKYLHDEMEDLLIEDCTEDDIMEYISFRMEDNHVNRIKVIFSGISSLYDHLRRKRIVTENPVSLIERPKKGLPVVEKHFLNIEQAKELQDKLSKRADLQLEVYINFALSTAGRVTATSNLRWDNIDFDNRVCENIKEKGGKIVDFYFSEKVKDLLLRLKEVRKKEDIVNDYVFLVKYDKEYHKATSNVLRSWAKKAGKLIDIDNLAPHSLRRSFATIAKANNLPLEDISTILNHESTDTTKIYIKEDKGKISKSKDMIGL
ncbi:tyrosine-type recombinase/integrase [Clostridioides difficile]|nr:tyrosine-type recombinase/integrase [Clostridioides difficile]EIS9625683.1 tyrosine-type recombinase/integrase [Clostridioides difficile]MBY1699522.1 tyrosine-type recombinase/integrase [Clostridioides difficile]MBZ0630746.1 tyrosine-type recombinase/integrase [Clostridioides difficile]MBZ0654898.1 tyrosine-type recombinase/integrase [Clostridioides difficile]